jgi:hypothetical protein
MSLSIEGREVAAAQMHYTKNGFIDTPTPWLVGERAYMATCPADAPRWSSPLGLFHVASAEQGFIQMMVDGVPIPDCAQSTTPCFRVEPIFDSTHKPYFYKLELYSSKATQTEALRLLSCAKELFAQLGAETVVVQTSKTSWDLNHRQTGIELGSYGYREFEGYKWTYGTGLAQPRLSYVLGVKAK